MLDYNVPGGKLYRGMAVGDILHSLTKDVRLLNRTHPRPCACLLFLSSRNADREFLLLSTAAAVCVS